MLILVFFGFTNAVAQEAVQPGTPNVALELLLPAPREMEIGAGHVSLDPVERA
jgi:hypothetical protein